MNTLLLYVNLSHLKEKKEKKTKQNPIQNKYKRHLDDHTTILMFYYSK